MSLTNFPNGITSFGIPQVGNDSGGVTGGGSIYGKTWFVDPNSGSDAFTGKAPDKAFASLTQAFTKLGHGDTVLCAGGNYSGNYTTPANSVARDVSIIATRAVSQVGGRAWASATVTSSPIFTIQARGWRISGFEFNPGATSSAITLNGTNANYFQVDNCSTWTGKYFLLNAGSHFARIFNNQIINLNATGSIAIGALTGIGGQGWEIIGNHFSDNYSHINFGGTRGLFASRIEGNTFVKGGAFTISTVLLDNRDTVSNTGGNAIVNNYFDVTKAQYTDDASTGFIRTQARDYGAGNSCRDGEADDLISA